MHPTYCWYRSADVHPPFPGLCQGPCTTGCSNTAPSSATGCKNIETLPSHGPAQPPLKAPELTHKGNHSPPQALSLLSLPPAASDRHVSLVKKAKLSLTCRQNDSGPGYQPTLLCTIEAHSSLPAHSLPAPLFITFLLTCTPSAGPRWPLPDGTGERGLSLQLAVGISKPGNYRSLRLLLSGELPWPLCTFADAA